MNEPQHPFMHSIVCILYIYCMLYIHSFLLYFVFVFDFDLGVRFDQYTLSTLNTTTTAINIKIHKDWTNWQEMDGTGKTHQSYYYYYYYSRSQCLLMRRQMNAKNRTNDKPKTYTRKKGKKGKKWALNIEGIKHWKNTISETELNCALCTPCRLYYYGYFMPLPFVVTISINVAVPYEIIISYSICPF